MTRVPRRPVSTLAVLAALALGFVLVSADPMPAAAATEAPVATPSVPDVDDEPTAEPTDDGDDTPSPTPPGTVTATPPITVEPTPTVTPPPPPSVVPTVAPTATPTAGAPPSATVPAPPADNPPPGSGELEPQPPYVTQVPVSPVTWVIAAFALLAGLIAGVVLRRRTMREEILPTPAPVVRPPVAGEDDPTAKLASLEAVGEAMIDAGYSVTAVRQALEEIAAASGYPDTEVVVFPTALFVSARGLGEVRTGAVSSGRAELTLAQTDALDDVIVAARTTPTGPAAITRAIEEIRAMPEPYTLGQRVLAYAGASAGIAVLLGASWGGTGIAAVLGAGVGWAQIRGERIDEQYRALVTVGCSFVVATIVLALATIGLDPGVLPSLIAPLVIFLPGGLLTTGVVELLTGHMMSGAGRLAAGIMRLVLLAAGVVGAAMLVGVPSLELTGSSQPIGPVGPWLAVAVFGVGIVIHQCGRAASIGWILLVLYVAYGAQVLGDIFFGGVLSAFVGAFAMTPVAALVARQRSGPAAFVSFLPAFWLLVPGSLGLVGVATILDGNSAGLNTLLTTASTMVAIALGTLAGSAVSSRLTPSHRALI
ncbi:MAG TPA: threonine/serine exporter family protein [Propionicimonas sp.]|nr:threonine/serine exporter family protein [Propionicimonas sp.]